MIVRIFDIVIAGLLMGGIYSLIATGLSLQYGVAKVLNIAHGEFIMIGALLTWTVYTAFGINPLVSLAICGPVTFILGFLIYRIVFTRLRTSSPSPAVFEANAMLAAFGLFFVIENIGLIIWGAGMRGYSYLNVGVNFLGTVFAANRLVALLTALVIGVIFYVVIMRTRLGKAIRAAAEDPVAAGLMGVNINQVLALCFGFGALLAGFAGVLVSMCYPIYATMGLEYTLIAIIVVVLGGLGSIPGSFIGGFILGLIGSIVSSWQPSLSIAAYYVLFMLLLLVKPTGILGK
ncbi:MAG: branched-chain amino acid ABC transporter permease [Dehalococcoidia bacterium]|nr:branched-chain amino acid ABC transporter permease [Dehalococcoidia bacterium]